MSNITLLPVTGLDPIKNLQDAKAFFTQHSPFSKKVSWDWDAIIWDVKGVCKSQARKANYEHLLYFSRDNQKGSNVKTSRNEMEPFHSKSLSDAAKCHITFSQIQKAKDYGTLQLLINAYRLIDNVIMGLNISVADLTMHHFRLAEHLAEETLQQSTYYRAACKLEAISKFFMRMKFTTQRIPFKKEAKRGEVQTNSDTRIDPDSILARNEKLLNKDALIAVGTLSNAALGGRDKIFQAVTEILFATGLRIDEVLTLDVDCLYSKEVEETNLLTGHVQRFNVSELRYRAKKGGGYRTKVIPDEVVPILQKGINTATNELQNIRNVVTDVLHAGYDFFPSLENDTDVFTADVWKEMNWYSSTDLSYSLRKMNIVVRKKTNPETNKTRNLFSTKELKKKTLDLARLSIRQLWAQVCEQTAAESLDKMLFISQHQLFHHNKRANEWKFSLFTHTQISDYLAGRPSEGVESVFERYELTFEGKPVRVNSHQFRHFLNTMLQLSDTVSEIEVARYFGRAYIGDNEAYDHTNKAKRVLDAADDILSSHQITPERAKEASIVFTLVDEEEALETIQDLTTTLITSIGMCSHDYNDSPCGKHYACLRKCSEYYRTKGSKSEVTELEKIKAREEKHIVAAKEAVDEQYHGANNWLLSHQALLDGCNKALAIEDDETIKDGERVQVFPGGNNKCVPI